MTQRERIDAVRAASEDYDTLTAEQKRAASFYVHGGVEILAMCDAVTPDDLADVMTRAVSYARKAV